MGANATLLSYDGEYLLIDAGIKFPQDDHFGVAGLVPDLSAVPGAPLTLVLTHGHEDHIGAVPHFVQNLAIQKIVAHPFTLDLVQAKYGPQLKGISLDTLQEDCIAHLGPFQVSLFSVNHSIPFTRALIVSTPHQALFFASDYKINRQNWVEAPMDMSALQREWNSRKADRFGIAMLDSTNALTERDNPEEALIEQNLIDALQEPGRVYITLFASNLLRIRSILVAAQKSKRKVSMLGRSLWNYFQLGLKHDLFDGLNHPTEDHPNADVVLLSGCQGDLRGALRRFAYGEVSGLKATPGERVIFSSRAIPGNLIDLQRIRNKLLDIGLVIDKSREYHSSGHASRRDILDTLKALTPDLFVPIHGEAEFIDEMAPLYQSVTLRNGRTLTIDGSSAHIREIEPSKMVPIDRSWRVIESSTINERRKMAQAGLLVISIHRSLGELKLNWQGIQMNETLESRLIQRLGLLLRKFRKEKTFEADATHLAREIVGEKLRPLFIYHD